MAKAKKSPPGRPRKEVNWKKAEQLASEFCTGEEIAATLGMSYSNFLRKLREHGFEHFDDWYKKGNQKGRASLRSLQWKSAKKGNVVMLIWLGKQILDQKDKKDLSDLVGDVTINLKVGHEGEDDGNGQHQPDTAATDAPATPNPSESGEIQNRSVGSPVGENN